LIAASSWEDDGTWKNVKRANRSSGGLGVASSNLAAPTI